MSSTVTTITTTVYISDESSHHRGSFHPARHDDDGPENEDIGQEGHRHAHHRSSDGGSSWLDGLPFPAAVKDMIRNKMNMDSESDLPSDSSAAKTINSFQKEHGIGLLSVEQMKEMADTGYCTGKDGKTFQVPPEVQAAAQKFMSNNGELFKKMESATDGKHDGQLGQGDYDNAVKDGTISANGGSHSGHTRGLQNEDFLSAVMNGHLSPNRPSEYSAAKTINQFQKDHDIGLLSVQQMKEMADTGYCTGKDGKTFQVPEEVQDAAKTFMDNNGELFKKMESATDGKHDGQLGEGDFDNALKDGTIGKNDNPDTSFSYTPDDTGNLPSKSSAADTIENFQKDKGIDLLSVQQMKEMADTGYCTDKNGKTFQAPEEVQNAAKRYMANDAEMFKTVESATTGTHDGLLSTGDADNARKDGSLSTYGKDDSADTSFSYAPDDTSNLPSKSSAADTIENFQKDKGIDLLSVQQMQEMADTGYCTDKNGKTFQVPEEVQNAAKRYMANDAEMFKSIESATTGTHDGLLSTGDADNARKDGTIAA